MDEYANNVIWLTVVQGLNLAKNRPTSLIWTEYFIPTVLKPDRPVFDKMLPVDDNARMLNRQWFDKENFYYL